MAGNIIFLNGTSSSGKAEIARSLQDQLDQPYLFFSIDQMLHRLPEKLMSNAEEDLPDAMDKTLSEIFPKTISALHRCIVTFTQLDVNLIVDHVLQRRDWLEECVMLLDGRQVFFVGVYCDPQEIQRKENQGMGPVGLGNSQIESVHAHQVYDLTVDTCDQSIREITEQIIQGQQNPPLPTAFQQLRKKFEQGEPP